jgi:glutathione S-transferase
MPTRVYVIEISHPAAAAVGMLRHKRIPHRVVRLMPGLHPLLVRFAGFPRHTVPALEMDGQRVQGSRAIARHLDRLRPEPPLYPADPAARAAVEEAEDWGERVLQPVPRRLFRYLLLTSADARTWMGAEVMRLPGSGVLQWFFMPAIATLARNSHADEATVRDTVARLPGQLDHVDALIAAGTIGARPPNAADFQILSGVRVLLEIEDVAALAEGRPCAAAARALFPDWVGPMPRGLSDAQLSDGSAGIVDSSR